MRNTVDLPEDLVLEEILSKAPTVSLARFQSTSKGWNALVKDGRLAKKHYSNAPRQSLVIMLIQFRVYLVSLDLHGIQDNNNKVVPYAKLTSQFSLRDPLSTNSSEEVYICNVIHCDGLLLCTTIDDKLVIWNPCSGGTRWIQPRNSYKESDYYALGYDNKSSGYKILRMERFGDQLPCDTEYEIYDFTSNLWRVVGQTTDWVILDCRRRGLYVKGHTYWLALTQHQELYSNFLLSFDFSTERFHSQPLPHFSYSGAMALSVVREEQLCLLIIHQDVDPSVIDVWVTTKIEITGAISWSKFLTAKANYKFSRWMSFLADEQNNAIVCCDITDVPNNLLHIVTEDRCIQVDHHVAECYWSLILSYVSTLVQIPQGL